MDKEEFSIPPPQMMVEQLSPEGLDILELMQKQELSPEEVGEKMLQLTPKDQATLLKINKYFAQVYEIEWEHNEEGYRQSQLALSVFERASVLEPDSVNERGTTLGKAIRVLERHGEKPPEDLDLDRWEEVPVEEE